MHCYRCPACGRERTADEVLFLDNTINFPTVCTQCEQTNYSSLDPQFKAELAFRKCLHALEGIKPYEKHESTSIYREIVYEAAHEDKVKSLLQDVFLHPVKPPGTEVDRENKMLTQEYGGVQRHQTLFRLDFSDYSLLAMMWPWADGDYFTLKFAVINRKEI